jgi:acetyl coenzyme A synthetase (ADP forming)-like protein
LKKKKRNAEARRRRGGRGGRTEAAGAVREAKKTTSIALAGAPTTPSCTRHSLDALFRPRSVAVVGASRRQGSIGREVLRNLVAGGFEGKVFPVNPHADVLHSIKCYPSVAAIPDRVDLAVIAVPKELVPRAMRACAAKGVGGVVIITAGFKETGARGAAAEARLVALAREHGMRIVGPNCMGIQNAMHGVRLNASFSRNFPRPGPVAFVSQSGAMGEAMLAHAERMNIGVSMFVSMGNRADVSANDLIEYWGREAALRCILLYLESFGNPRNFVPSARRVSRDKAIVMVKSGRSRAGALAASSHTGALAGSDSAIQAILGDCGVQRVDSVEELFDVGLALSRLPLPVGPRVAVLTNAGGPAILATDALIASGLEMAPLEPRTRARLRAALVPEASVQNPVDMVAGATAENYRHSLRLLLRDRTVDMALVIFVPPVTRDPVEVANALFAAAREAKKPVVGCFMSRDAVMDDIAARSPQDWVPVYLYPESAVRALAALAERRRILDRPEGRVRRLRVDRARVRRALRATRPVRPGRPDGNGRWLGHEAKRVLAEAYGLPLVPGGLARTGAEAVKVAERVGFPVVMKIAVPTQQHKTDVGGVVLDVPDAAAVRAAFPHLMRPRAEGVVVQKMLSGAREVVIGFTSDANLGPILMFGLGGIHVEVLKDVVFAPCPVSDARARELVRSIRGYPILAGIRGQPPVDEDALVDVIQRISQIATDLPEIAELEINPLFAFPDGVVAVDLRARVGANGRAPHSAGS